MTRTVLTRTLFNTLLGRFVAAVKESMDTALEISNAALAHCAEHRDVCYLQEFLDAMPANWVRRQAFLAWMDAHAPIAFVTVKDNKFKLSLDKEAEKLGKKFDLKGAEEKPFWDFAPEPKIVRFGTDEILKDLETVMKKYGKDRFIAKTVEAKELIGKVKQAIATIAATVPVNQHEIPVVPAPANTSEAPTEEEAKVEDVTEQAA